MRNLLAEKDKYYKNFADAVYSEFNRIRYGINTCGWRSTTPLYLAEMRKEIVDYQAMDDGDALTQVSIQHMGWLPVYYPSYDSSCEYMPPWADMTRYRINRCSRPNSIGMSYVGQNNSTNLIEVNAGGCITRININPSITINNNNNSNFVFTQNCADPQAIWYINHNLNIVPNVWAEDCNGDNISGVLDVVDNDTITLTFSSPVAGKAYLS
jgi:hypothetical protein